MRQVVRQDIFNISRAHDVRKLERRDEQDLQSVALWLQEMQNKSSVLVGDLLPGSFNLVVMNEHQAQLTREHDSVVYIADLPVVLDRHYRLITLTAVASQTDAYLLAYALFDQTGLQPLQV